MPLERSDRNLLANAVTAARRLLVDDIVQQLKETYGIHEDETVPMERLGHLTPDQQDSAAALRELVEHHAAAIPGKAGERRRGGYARTILEIAFTTLNRFAAIRMCEERELIAPSLREGLSSDGYRLFESLAHDQLGGRHETYRVYLQLLFDELAVDLGVLFDRSSPQSAIFPRERCLEELLRVLNQEGLRPLWSDDETIGWIYQYFNPPEERKAMRDASPTPRTSRELAVRNQFFTPRYVVEFLVDNTLGRIWWDMRQGRTRLAEQCRVMVLRPGDEPPADREPKDPRDLRVLDPACGSGHFLLYAFDLFEVIYEEAWEAARETSSPTWSGSGRTLAQDYATIGDLRSAAPALILRHNLHGIDIDPRAAQIAALALWLRAQRSYQRLGLKAAERPVISRVNLVAAEPMPGEAALLDEVCVELHSSLLADLLRQVHEGMRLADEAGSLLRIEKDLRTAIEAAKQRWQSSGKAEQLALFPSLAKPVQQGLFPPAGISAEEFWAEAEGKVLGAARMLAERAGAADSVTRRLFAEDAARGFAFIDLCRQTYDVVLMNPPFGEACRGSKTYIEKSYPRSKNDVYAAFVERWLERLTARGRLGAITSRTGFFLTTFQKWREEVVLGEARPVVFADLGHGVMDSAMVEAAAYCLERR